VERYKELLSTEQRDRILGECEELHQEALGVVDAKPASRGRSSRAGAKKASKPRAAGAGKGSTTKKSSSSRASSSRKSSTTRKSSSSSSSKH
jgi:hypothetical protein